MSRETTLKYTQINGDSLHTLNLVVIALNLVMGK